MVAEEINKERKCSECIYYEEDNYCERKKTQVEDKDVCLHFVSAFYTRSLENVMKKLVKLYSEENEA